MLIDIEAEKKLVEEVVQGLCEADLSKDLDRIMTFFAEEIVYMPPGVPPLFGKEAVREYLDGAFDLLEDAKAGSDRVEVSDSRDLAYSVGWFKSKRVNMEHYLEFKYHFTLKKIENDWKIVAESVSRNSREGGEFFGYNPKMEK